MLNEVMNPVDKVRETFNFGISKLPLSVHLGEDDKIVTPFYGLFRDDTMEVVTDRSVSKKYVPHQTDDVVALTEAAAEAFDGDIDVKCHFRMGHYVEIAPTEEYRHSVYGTQDSIFPRMMIRAGYDGKSFSSTIGMYRDACQNMMMLDKVSATKVSIRHKGGLRTQMDSLIQTFQTLKESWVTVTDLVAHLENSQVNMVEFLNSIYGEPPKETGKAATVHKNRTTKIFERLSRELFQTGRTPISASNDWQVSGWMAYNAVQGYVQHDATRKRGTTDFDRVILANRDPKVLKAQDLVLAAV